MAAPGCVWPPDPPDREVAFFLSSRQDVLRLRRVVFVELSARGETLPETAWDTTQALASAVQDKRLFHLDVVRRADPRCRDLSLDRLEPLTLQQLAQMRQDLNCDAVMFGHVNHFQPFPRMQLGLSLKLMDLKDGKLVWGIDNIWDSTTKETERAIKKYFHEKVRSGYDPLGYELVLKSPRAFQKFVAYEAAETLPPRTLPAAPTR